MACRAALLGFVVSVTCSSCALAILHPRIMPMHMYPGMFDTNQAELSEEARETILKEPDVLDPRLAYMRGKCAQVFGDDPEHFALPKLREDEKAHSQGDSTGNREDDSFPTSPTSMWEDPASFARTWQSFQQGCVMLKAERSLRLHEDDTELSHLHDVYVSTLGAEMKLHEDLVWADLESLHAQRVKQILKNFGHL